MMVEGYNRAEAYRVALLVQHVHATSEWCLNCTAVGCWAASWSVETIGRVHAERKRDRLAVLRRHQ